MKNKYKTTEAEKLKTEHEVARQLIMHKTILGGYKVKYNNLYGPQGNLICTGVF